MIVFRALARSDLHTLQRWLNTAHVYEWWGGHASPGALGGSGTEATTELEVELKYGPTIDHGGTTHRFIIEHANKPIGLIQWYRLRDFANYAHEIGEDPESGVGIDLLIGESSAVGHGLGSQSIERFVSAEIFSHGDINRVVANPAATNGRSIRAFEKAGFRIVCFASVTGEPISAAIMVRYRM